MHHRRIVVVAVVELASEVVQHRIELAAAPLGAAHFVVVTLVALAIGSLVMVVAMESMVMG